MATIDIKGGVTSSGLIIASTTLNVSSGGKIIDTTMNSNAVGNIYAGAQASETILNAGAQFRVYCNAVAQGIDANAGATLVLYAGGTASDVTLANAAMTHFTVDAKTNVTGSYVGGGNFSVTGGTASGLQIGTDCSLTAYTAGLSAVNITLTGNGRLNFNVVGGKTTYIQGTHQSGSFLLSGGVASGFLLNDGVVQNVSGGGIASDTVLYGDQYLSGGTAINTELYGNQLIAAGGRAWNTDVASGGKIIVVSGSASDVTLAKGGTLVITDGAALNVQAASGGIIQIAVGNSSVLVNGTADGVGFSLSNNIASGFMLYAGGCLDVAQGTVLDTTVSSGGTVIISSGLLRATTICKGGSATLFGGTAQAIVVSSGGKLLQSGGFAEGTILLKSSLQSVSAGAVAVDTIANGSQFVYAGGSASGTVLLSGGRLSCFASGRVEDVTVGSGARIFVSGAVSDIEVCSGGTAFVYQNSVLNGNNVLSGGVITYSGGVSVYGALTVSCGSLNFLGNNVASGAEIALDLSGVAAGGTDSLIKGYGNLSGDFSLDASISAGQIGAYFVATSATALTSLDADIDGSVAVIQAGTSYVDYANHTEYSLTGTAGNVYISGAVSTKDLDEISGTAAMQTVNGSDKGAKWGNSTSFESGTICAGDGAVNNVWLEVDTENSAAGTILYGGAGDSDVAGKVSVNIANGSFKAVMGGAATADHSIGSLELSFSEGSTGVIYGAGFGSVDGDVSIVLSDTAEVTGQIYGGAIVLSGAQSVVGGSIDLELSGGTVASDVIGGARVQADMAHVTTVGEITVNVDGTSFTGGASKNIYGAGWVFGKNVTASRAEGADYVTQDVTIHINSDVAIGDESGRGIFGGALAATYAIAEVDGDVAISVEGATVGNLFGGGWAQSGASSNVLGNVTISLDNSTADVIYGGGAHGENKEVSGTTLVGGDVSITIKDSTVRQVYAVGQTEGDTVSGSATVTLQGSSTVDYLYGTGFNGFEGSTSTTLSLEGFTGSVQKELSGFQTVVVDKETAATFASDAEITVTSWSFRLEDRTSDDAVLTWQNGAFETAEFDLTLGTDAAAWTVCDLSGDDAQNNAFSDVTFNLEIGGTTISDYKLGTAISGTGTGWDGASLNYSDETGLLKFTLA